MRILKRILALAIGTTAAVSIALLGAGSDRQSQTAEPQTPAVTISALSAGIQVQTTEPRVGNIASAPKPAVQFGAAAPVKYQWFACDKAVPFASSSLDPSCSAIDGAVTADVTLTNAEVGKRVLFSMSVGNGPVAFSAATEAAVSPAPTLAATPTGLNKSLRFTAATTPALNSKITVTRGLWPAAGTGYVVSYEWLRCTDVVAATLTAPDGCTVIPGAIAASYTVTAADVGSRIVTHVTATLAGVTSEIWTNSIGPVYKAVKYYKGATVAAGQETYPYLVGSAVTANEGTWDGPPNFTYQWYSCTKKVAAAATLNVACKAIAGATRDSFTPTLAQNGKYLMVRISGSTPLATTVVTTFSAASTKVLDDPNNTKVVGLPSALPIVGNAITAAAGTWTGSPAPVKTYQWYVCETIEEAAGADKPDDCDAIAGATSISYTPVQAHYTKFLLVEEIATSLAGSNSIFSPSTAQVLSRPVYESDPVVLGVNKIGEVLSATPGTGASSLEDSVDYQWLSCATANPAAATKPANCNPIAGATGSDFTPTRTVEGLFIAVQVTLKNSAGTTVRVSGTTVGFIKSAPGLDSADLAPTVDPVVNTPYSAPSGLWRGAPTPTLTYQWMLCTDEGAKVLVLPAGCSEISGATGPSFTPLHAQAAGFLRVRITADNELGTYQVWSGTSPVVKEKALFVGTPIVTGVALVGTPLALSETMAYGVPVPTRTIAWYQCKNAVATTSTSVPTAGGCTVLAGQTSASYLTTAGDLDKYIASFVTQTNSLGSVSTFTATSVVIKSAPKLINSSVAAPGLPGVSPKVGVALTAPSATWIGTAPVNKVYQWYSCADAIPATSPDISDICAEIPGETAASFTPTVSEVGRFVLVRVGAVNTLGAAFMFSPTTLEVLEAPNFTSDPTISGGKLTGESLAFDMLFTRGSPEPSVSYSWYRCAAPLTTVLSTTTCDLIAGATGDAYTLVAGDLDKYIAGAVTLKSTLGTVTKITTTSAKIQGAPAIVGTLSAPTAAAVKADSPIVSVPNAWTGSPLVGKLYQWFACPAAFASPVNAIDPNCTAITGATGASFTPTTAQVGKFLTIRTIASNTIGTVTVFSPTTSVVNETPSFQGDPTIDDLSLVGNKLTATLPATRGFPTPTPTYTWYRCTAAVGFPAATVPATCSLIAGASADKYTLDTADLDKFVLAGVTLTNTSGTVTRYTSSSVSIQGLPKLSNVLGLPSSSVPAASGPRIGTLQNAPTNVWTGSPRPSVSLQWMRCQDVDTTSSNVIVPCDEIPGATSATYTPVLADKTFALRVRITATNSLGTTTIWSGSTPRTQQPPSFGAEPTLNEFIAVGSLVSINTVNQIAYPTASETYLWYRCTSAVAAPSATKPASCTQIMNESISSHTILPNDVDNYLVAQITLNNDAGSVTRFTASTAKIISPPNFDQEPQVVGQGYVTGTLTLGPFNVSAKPAATVKYQWYYCSSQTLSNFSEVPKDTCFVIPGATGLSYNPTESDVGKFVSVLVTASNIAGEVNSFSKTSSRILLPPKNVIAPVVSGGTVVGDTLTTDTGTWTPATGVTFDYKWYSCVKATTASDTVSTTDCTVVTGATTNRFTTADAQVGRYIVAAVTAKNFTVNVTKYSASSEIIASVPVYVSGMNVSLPAGQGSTSGAPRVGYRIAAVEGTWASTPAPSYVYQWYVCASAAKTSADKSLGADCRDINGATAKEFEITQQYNTDYNLVGKYLGVKITGTNKAGSDFAYSVTAAKTVTMPPQLATAPEISGYRYVDGVLTGTLGTFTGTQPLTVTQAWWQCDNAIDVATTVQPAGCVKLVPTTATIKLTLAMKGKYVTTASIGTNDAGTLTVWAPSSVPVTTGAINVVPPTISVNPAGQPKVGATLTANHGTWSGDPALTEESYTYQWYSCAIAIASASYTLDPAAECIRVGDAVNTTYQPVRDDAGRYIVVSVTGTNSQGGSKIFSSSTTKVNLAPELVIAPLQSGTAFVSTRQGVSAGTWFAVPDPTFAYQWLLCDSAQLTAPLQKPADCTAITGATSDVYSPLIGQVGKFLMVQVTASNIAGSTVAYSLTSDDIKSAPVNLTAPTIVVSNGTTGLPVALQSTLSTSGGTWQGRPTPSLEYQWFSCATELAASKDEPEDTADCKAVSERGVTATYEPVASDRGRFIAVKVFAKNIHATITHWSATTSVINMAPVADVIPSVSGVAFLQSIVSAKNDTWISHPEPTKTYQWFWCGDLELPSACTQISGASANTFAIPPTQYLGRSLIVKVVATNKFGTATSYSLASPRITSGPVSTSAHVITGSIAYPPAAGSVLSTNDGTWAGDPRPTLTYQWYRCSILVASSTFELDPKCSAITGATSNTYALTDVDPGNSLVVGITGQNSWGTSTRFSASTPIVTEKVRVITLPSLLGKAKIDEEITGDEGVWRGYPTPTTSYQWYRCLSATPASPVIIPAASGANVVPAGCTRITNATKLTYLVSASDKNYMLVFLVTKTNIVDNVTTTISAYSQSSLPAAQAPVLLAKPTITSPGVNSGTNPKVGSVWTMSDGVWATEPAATQAYQWYRCDSRVATGPTPITALPDIGCAAIAGATSKSYTVTADDSGKFLSVESIASNAADTVHQWSNSTLSVLQVPIAITPPTVSGERQRTKTLTVDQGIWTGSPTPVIAFQWYSCTAPIAATSVTPPPATNICSQLPETSATYIQTPSDDGRFITATVSGTSGTADPTVYWVKVSADEATAKAPTARALPRIYPKSGTAAVGEIFSIEDFVWDAAPTPANTFAWYACDTANIPAGATLPSGCVAISGQSSQTYVATVELADSRKYLMASVTATNIAGSVTSYSQSYSSIIDKGVNNTKPASISATSLVVPTSVSWTTGEWSSNNQLRITHKWLYCSSALASTYSYIPAECEIFANIDPLVPTTTGPLAITPADEISGQYVSLYEKVEQFADGKWQKVRERLTPTTGQLLEAPSLRANDPGFVAPKVDQDMVVGYATTAATGSWVAAINGETSYTWRGAQVGTFAFQWFTCAAKQSSYTTASLPAGCSYITTSVSRPTNTATITPLESEIGQFLGVRITATNASGSAVVWTNTSLSVTQEVANINIPALGTASVVGDRLTLNGGLAIDWKGTPTPALTVEWYSCTTPYSVAPTTKPADCTLFVNGTAAPNEGITIPLERSLNTQYLMVRVSGTNTPWVSANRSSTVSLFSATSKRIISRPYINGVLIPTLSGNADVGSSLNISSGNWLGTLPMSWQGRWFACDTAVPASTDANVAPGCTLFKSETQNVTLTHAQVGKYIVGQMVATNVAGVTYQSAAASRKTLEPPTIVTPPEVTLLDAPAASGKIESGQRLGYNPAVWDGAPTPTATVSFYQCVTPVTTAQSSIPGNCTAVTGVAGSVLTLGDAQAGAYIVAVSTANNTVNGGSKTSYSVSASLGPVYRAPYFDTAVAPTISVTPVHVGSVATFTKTTVKGFEAPTTTYAWYICNSAVTAVANNSVPTGCSIINNADNAPLTIPAAAAGKFVLAIQTASATWTSAIATRSTLTTAVITASPSPTTVPTTAGDDYVGGPNKLTVDRGVWSSYPAITDNSKYSISWFQCDSPNVAGNTPTGCGATALLTYTANAPQSYAPTSASAGKYLVAKVVATAATNKNAVDSVTYFTSSVGPIREAATLPGQPAIVGGLTPDVGTTLSMTTTAPRGYPVNTPTYDWYLCTNTSATIPSSIPADCELQADFSSKAFPLTSAAAGKYVLGWVTASNSLGSASKATAFSNMVKMGAVNTALPNLGAGDEVGTPISANPGGWQSTPAPTFTYQWYSCQTASSTIAVGCTAIGGATSASSFTPTELQASKYILANVTATTAIWSGNVLAVKATTPVGPIRMPATVKLTPNITGTAHVGETLALSFGANAILGYPAPDYSYDWYACDSAVTVSAAAIPSGCSIISGWTSKPLIVDSANAGKYIIAAVTATNYATALRTTLSTAAVTATLTNVTAPALSGDLYVGGTSPVTASAGVWSSTPAVNPANDLAYSFFACSTATWNLACTAISTANSKVTSVTLTSGMQGKYVIARVTATVLVNKTGTGVVTVSTNAVGPVEAAPSFSVTPSTTGVMHVGSEISAVSSGELGVPAPEKLYSWFFCTSAVAASSSTMPAGCTEADAAINGTDKITLPAVAGGKYVSVLVTIKNSRGQVSANTIASTVVTATPSATVAPVIGGDDVYAAGKSVTVTSGTWTTAPNTATKTFTYSWYACPTATSAIANCGYLGDTTTGSLATTEAMVDKFVIAKVTVSVAVNKTGAGTAFAYSNASNRIRKAAVFNATPTVGGYMHIGETLTATTGNPTGVPAPTASYTWYVCTSPVTTAVATAPAGCTLDAAATLSTYSVPTTAAGSYILVIVKAASDTDLTAAYRSSVSTVAVSSPAVLGTTAPVITGTAVLNSPALTVSTGSWTWKPSAAAATYSYKWFACPSTISTFVGGTSLPAGCNAIASQTSNALTLTAAELGFKIVSEVTVSVATNQPSPSKTIYYTPITGLVMSKPVAGATAPSIGSTSTAVGAVLTAKLGTWTGSPTPSLSYTWYKCPATTTQPTTKLAPATCTALTVKGDLTITADLKGLKILLQVLAANDAGNATNISTLLDIK